ncbi:MAG: S41 family peptidase [Muribaculaceae bacterium]|nr:S41 family peptidase [Muribaculaceae bacterium]
MKLKRNPGLVALPLLVTLGVVGGVFIGRYITRRTLSTQEEKLRTVLRLIDSEYVDRIDVDSLIEASLPDLLGSLDPHSAYIPASDLEAVNDDLQGSFSGVGVSFQILNDTVNVIEVIPGGPAEKVGILPGDRIIQADTVTLAGKNITNEDVFKTLRGQKGTTVELVIKRSNSSKPLNFDVVRGDIPVNSVDCSYMVNDSIGYLRVTKFARNTYNEFFTALSDLKADGAKKFVVDLRGNSGGFMDQAIYMANEFLPAGRMIVYTKGRRPENETMAISDGHGRFKDSEITVLTNEYSASASEIFAGAIQDNDRGLVIGRRSFGKGLVQNQTELPDSSAIRLTVARYYTPSGRSIQKEYTRGKDGKYELDIVDRFTHGEFYNADSIKFDESKIFSTSNGRTVYGGGGIMPDIFVPEDTTGYTSYYVNVANNGLIQKFAYSVADKYRGMLNGVKSIDRLLKVLPRDNTLLENFVNFAVKNGVPARWYYINQSRQLLLGQIKAMIARDVLGYPAFIEMLNESDPAVKEAIKALENGKSPIDIKLENKKDSLTSYIDRNDLQLLWLVNDDRELLLTDVTGENELTAACQSGEINDNQKNEKH